MPQARSGGSGSSSGRKRTASSSGRKTTAKSGQTKRSSGSSARGTGRASSATRSTRATGAAKSRSSSSSSRARSTKAATGSTDARVEAAAQRLRKLNERIIEAGKDAGEVTLATYEKALKSIASTLERGPGSSDIEWISNLATTQAKFIRDVTASWTKSAREMLK